MQAAISIQNISKYYGELLALDDVSLTIEPGEFFGLLGPNGAGKTTLISILAGLVTPSKGHAAIMGADVQKTFREARRMLGVVPQELVFDPFFTVRETLRFQSGYFGIRNNDAWVDEIMANLDLTSKADGHTIVLTTHYLEEAEALCQRIAMLKQGKIVALDTTANLLARHGSVKKDGEGKTDLEEVFVNIMSGANS
jgi:ABC-2 type transport system ATP-binding protein